MLKRTVLSDFRKKIITTTSNYNRQDENQFLPPAVNNHGHANTPRTTSSLYSSRTSALAIAGERIGRGVESLRRYATTAGESKLIRPPIRMGGIAGIYATAIYSAAHKTNALEVVEKDLHLVCVTFQNDTVFRNFMLAPHVSIAMKLEGLKDIRKLGIHHLTYNLLATLIENRRMNKLLAVIDAYMEIMAAHRKGVVWKIISAKPLYAKPNTKLAAILRKYLQGKAG